MLTSFNASDYSDRIQTLQSMLKRRKLDGFLVPMADEYQNEIVPPSSRRVAFLSGFTGSAALILFLNDQVVFFTDGRYTLQANKQLPKDLFLIVDSGQKTPAEWLAENTRSGQKIGFDPWLHTPLAVERYQKALVKSGAELVPVQENPVDLMWRERPAPPVAPVYAHDIAYAGKTCADKRLLTAKALQENNVHAAVITDPASIAWLLNVRGGDVPHSPLPLSTAILRADGGVEWFVEAHKFTSGLDRHLGPEVTRHDPKDFQAALKRLGEAKCRVLADPEEIPYGVLQALKDAGAVIERGQNPCALPKACKNPVELDGMRAAHRRDGAALCKLLAWIDQNAGSGALTEIAVEKKLLELRKANQLFREPSFDTIAAAGPNGAIVHYRATEESNEPVKPDMLFLLDSGGQYYDGTTDVTRAIAVGKPLLEMCDRFTRVLKGHIALAGVIFPEGTTGAELDVLARQHLWALGLDYNHGTGHGVGCYLNVHEGPQTISKRGHVALKAGMVVSNEPGYYKTGHYGIRIENLQAVIERIDLSTSERKMYAFETLTLAPIDRRLIALDMLTSAELAWLNDYHARVRQAIRPLVDEETAAWLIEATEIL